MNGHRQELPRCEYGVWRPTMHGDVEKCGEPSVAVWKWESDPLYVCEEHDELIYNKEGEEEG